jgi:DNA-binding helix-hairpin-helix protein with protein kinase domain
VPTLPPPRELVAFTRRKARASTTLWLGIGLSVLAALFWSPGALAGVMVFPIIALVIRGRVPDEARSAEKRLSAAQERFDAILRHIDSERSRSALASLEAKAQTLYRGLRDFQHRRSDRLQSLERSRVERQLRRFLDQFEVKDARLKGVGPGLFATLVSHGVETADDVTVEKLEGIRGFGPKRISALLEWRRQVSSRFRFNPSDPADTQERTRLERELQLEYAREVADLRRVAEQIKAHAGPLRQHVATLAGELDDAQRELATARAAAVALGKAA